MNVNDSAIERVYESAVERYGTHGVDVGAAMARLDSVSVSFHCWQGDDVGGFESGAGLSGGGILATGDYPGKARTADELRADMDLVYRLVPGRHRFNLHAIYLESGAERVERNEIEPEHFEGWIDWAKEKGLGLDFNCTLFSHPLAESGFTLAHRDDGIRQFWIEHCIAARRIGAHMGRELGTPCVYNVWIPDGFKDTPVDRKGPRELLKESLDAVFSERFDRAHVRDAVESKLFGIGSESYVVGSYDFYLGYALKNDVLLCLDTGHFHPTESVPDKISSVLTFLDEILLHVSRGVRWDSDHVPILNDNLRSLAEELVRGNYLERVHIGLDYFDASINRVAAYCIGSRSLLKALLAALLEPFELLARFELEGDFTSRLALLEEVKTLPLGGVWDYYCMTHGTPPEGAWLGEAKNYEEQVLSKR